MQRTYHSESFEKVRYRYFATYKAGSEVVVATIFNFYRFYGNKTGNISVIVKSMKKLDKWNETLTLIASTVDEYSSTQKLIN